MSFLHTMTVAAVLSAAAFVPVTAYGDGLTPGAPSVKMTFSIVDGQGVVSGTLTAPTSDSSWQTLPEGTLMDITVTRSCYELSESDIPVVTFTDMTPGQVVTFEDHAEPAWQYDCQYTYKPVAYIGENSTPYSYGGSLTPGIHFSFDYNATKAEPTEDATGIRITAVIPTQTSSWPAEDLTIDMTALEFHRITDRSTWPYQTELIHSIANPVKGETYTYVDENPVANTTNFYMVKCVSDFGSAETTVQAFSGYDVPKGPYPVKAEYDNGGIHVYWTAPTEGVNYGTIQPEKTVYNVYRCWGQGEDNCTLIAEGIAETEVYDYGTDMEVPRNVRYEVVSYNDLGKGGNTFSSYSYDLTLGPDESLPFIETFDGGYQHMWTLSNSSYYSYFNQNTAAYYNNGQNEVLPYSGNGLVSIDFSSYWITAGSTGDMTSYKINLGNATTPAATFHYYAIPDNDASVEFMVSTDGEEFVSLKKVNIADDSETPGWRSVTVPLSDYVASGSIYVRLHTTFESKGTVIILDEVSIVDYPSVGNIEVETDPENCTATLTWEDPSTEYAKVVSYIGYVDGESVGEVSLPWVFEAPEYKVTYSLAVEAVYDGVVAAQSAPVGVMVPRPAYTEFTLEDYVFYIVPDQALNEQKVVIKEYLGSNELLSLPSGINYDDVHYTVVGILEGAFKDNQTLVSVAIPETYTEIGDEAFAGCSELMAVGLPDALESLGAGAFRDCVNLLSIELPSGVTTVKESTFENCRLLTEVTFGAGLVSIESRAFAGCESLVKAVFNGETVPSVALDAFEGISSECKGTCPDGCVTDYEAVEGLSPIDFNNSGIGSIGVDGAVSTEYYDLNGVRIENPAAGGIYIVKSTGADGATKVAKVIVR